MSTHQMDAADLLIIARILLQRGISHDPLTCLEMQAYSYMLQNIAENRPTFAARPGVPSNIICGDLLRD